MQAAVLRKVGEPPTVEDFDEPDGEVVDVRVAGCNPVDLQLASGAMGEPTIPSVVGKEGAGAGPSADIPFLGLMSRTHVGHLNNAMGPEVLRAGYRELARHAADGEIRVDIRRYGLADADDAWRAQAESPHAKLVIVP